MTIGYSPVFPLQLSSEGGYAINKKIVDVVRQNLKNLMLTNPGERIFDLNFGVGLKTFLFEQNIQNTHDIIKNKIQQQVYSYMPFLDIEDIIIVQDQDEPNLMYIQMKYFIKNISKYDILNLTVK